MNRRFRTFVQAALVCCVSGIASAVAHAQTVRPLIAELSNPAKGRVEYVNDSDTPLNVVLTAKGFSVSEDGGISYRALDPYIHVKLSATSFRIQPHDSYFVFYEAKTDSSIAWFVIYAAFSGFAFRTQNGMSVRLELPHTVYLLPKESLDKSQVRITRAELEPEARRVLIEVENTGDYFGRAMQTVVTGNHKRIEGPGFPIFPRSKRRIEVPIEEMQRPEAVVVDFQRFKLEEKVGATP
jgi:hypothetical protein